MKPTRLPISRRTIRSGETSVVAEFCPKLYGPRTNADGLRCRQGRAHASRAPAVQRARDPIGAGSTVAPTSLRVGTTHQMVGAITKPPLHQVPNKHRTRARNRWSPAATRPTHVSLPGVQLPRTHLRPIEL